MTSSNELHLPLDALMPLIREQLELGQTVRFSPKGTSMLPMLRQGRDSVTLAPVPDELHKFDLPLYRRENGQYVLHRVVAVGDTYTCMGDNQFVPERGLRREQMIGVVTSFSRDGREYDVHAPAYRLYCRLWYCSRPVRRLWRRISKSLSLRGAFTRRGNPLR